MISLNAQCLSTVTIVSQTAMDDDHWRAFGYKRRPHRGKIFTRFVASSVLERETTLLRELSAASFGTIFRWALDREGFQHRELFIAKLLEYLIDGLQQPLWPVFRFTTRKDGIDFLRQACSDYSIVDDNDRPRLFLSRCMSVMSQQVPNLWLLGAAFLFTHPNSVVWTIRLAMNDAGVADNPDCDIEVNDNEFVKIADEVLRRAT